MSFFKRFLKVLIFGSLVLIPFNYFFAHFAFNRVVNKFVQAQVPKGQKLEFNSSFHMYPSPLIRIQHLDYTDNQGSDVSINTLDGMLDLLEVIKTKQLIINAFFLDGLSLRLPVKQFDEFVKAMMFPIIRESLGVPRDPTILFPNAFIMKNIQLARALDNTHIETFDILTLTYDMKRSDFLSMCFTSADKTGQFYKQFIRQYLFAAKVKDECIVFTKSLLPQKPPSIPKKG